MEVGFVQIRDPPGLRSWGGLLQNGAAEASTTALRAPPVAAALVFRALRSTGRRCRGLQPQPQR
eukprot:7993479-Pyramimonas_sp.AAC.1